MNTPWTRELRRELRGPNVGQTPQNRDQRNSGRTL
jgi:hypothetical protein